MPSRLSRPPHLDLFEVTRPSVLLALIVVLLATLAGLQYRWIGKLSDFQREQMERTLRTSTDRFARDLERELERLWYVFSVRGARRAGQEIAEDYAEWVESSGFPQLVAEVYWVHDLPGLPANATAAERLGIERVGVGDGALAPTPWPPLMQTLRGPLVASADAHRGRGLHRSDSFTATLDEHTLAFVVAQTATPLKSWTVALLRRDVLDGELLPALVRDHFGTAEQREYEVRLIDDAYGGRVVYSSSGAEPSTAGAVPDYLRHLHDYGGTLVENGGNGRNDDDRSLAVAVTHRAGSLDSAVGRLRQRNLAYSFGVVAVLAASVGILAVAARRARRLAERQMEFVAGVSHELRTPIAGISSLSQNLADGVVQDLDQAAHYGRTIHTQSKRLANMVEGVLHFSAIRSGRYRFSMQPVDVGRLVSEALESLDPSGDGEAPTVSVPAGLPAVQGDERALLSVVRNLISNAQKFSGAGGTVRISAALLAGDRPCVELSVADSGPGIGAAEKSRIFEPFFRGRAAEAGQIEGSGLGLSLVREIVDAHGGAIEVDSREGRGSTFRVRLPAADPAPAGSAKRPAVATEGLRTAKDGGGTP